MGARRAGSACTQWCRCEFVFHGLGTCTDTGQAFHAHDPCFACVLDSPHSCVRQAGAMRCLQVLLMAFVVATLFWREVGLAHRRITGGTKGCQAVVSKAVSCACFRPARMALFLQLAGMSMPCLLACRRLPPAAPDTCRG